MDYQEKTHQTGRMLEVEGKSFFIPEQVTGRALADGDLPVRKNYDEEYLLE